MLEDKLRNESPEKAQLVNLEEQMRIQSEQVRT